MAPLIEVGAVPFIIGGGFDDEVVSTRGRVAFGGASLMLELDMMREASGDRTTRKIVLGIEEFATCQYRRGLLHDRMLLRTTSLAALGGVPGALEDMVVLRVARRNRELAEALVRRIDSALSERQYPGRSAAGLRAPSSA